LAGLRPVANAFGASCGQTYTFGIGSPARCASRSTMSTSSGASARVTGTPPIAATAILSEK